jgi:hypothetical protein
MGAHPAPVWVRAIPVVFVNALLQQPGLPVPAPPTLLIAGSRAVSQGQLVQMIAAAMVASLAADALRYAAGRVSGYRVLIRLCKLSPNPGSCVTSTETLFIRWGIWFLIVAKLGPRAVDGGPAGRGVPEAVFRQLSCRVRHRRRNLGRRGHSCRMAPASRGGVGRGRAR